MAYDVTLKCENNMFFLNGEIQMGYLSIATRPAVACALDFPRDYHRTQGRGVSFTPYLSIPTHHPLMYLRLPPRLDLPAARGALYRPAGLVREKRVGYRKHM